MSERKFQRCTNCVMDTTDSAISFDEKGVCDFCNDYYRNILPNWRVDEESKAELLAAADKIKKKSKNKKYDCIIGMSGGVDSSYLCYIAKEVMGCAPCCTRRIPAGTFPSPTRTSKRSPRNCISISSRKPSTRKRWRICSWRFSKRRSLIRICRRITPSSLAVPLRRET